MTDATHGNPGVTAVMVTYQSRGTIDAGLAALKRCFDRGLARVVIVDNVSTDGTRDVLEQHRSWATVVHSPANIGFGRGCNLGLALAETPYVVFVNPDAEFEPEACAALLEFHRAHPKAGLISPAMVRSDGSHQHVGGLTTPMTVLRAALGLSPPPARRVVAPGEAPFRTDWVCGALLQAPTELLRKLGGFDPRFFLYFEETDLCARVAETGHEIWAVGTVLVHHGGGASAAQTNASRISGCIAEHFFRSRFYYLRKHFGLLPAIGAELGELACYGARAGVRLLSGRSPRDPLRRFSWPILSQPRVPRSV